MRRKDQQRLRVPHTARAHAPYSNHCKNTGLHPNASFEPFENCLKPVFNSFQELNV